MSKKLSWAQSEAIREIKAKGNLVRSAVGSPGYWQWRFAQSGHMTNFPSATVDALVKRGLLKVERLIDGRCTATLV